MLVLAGRTFEDGSPRSEEFVVTHEESGQELTIRVVRVQHNSVRLGFEDYARNFAISRRRPYENQESD